MKYVVATIIIGITATTTTTHAWQQQQVPSKTSCPTRRTKTTICLGATPARELDDISSSSTNNNLKVNVPDMKAYAKGYKTVTQELPYKVCDASVGSIPSDLCGTYYRSGPAMFTAGSIPPVGFSAVVPKTKPVPDGADSDRMVKHPFDGDGAVVGVTFSGDGKATARFRFVKTAAFEVERKKGSRMYDGMDSTRAAGSLGQGNDFPLPMYRHHLQPGLNKKRKNTSSTRSIYWGKRLLSLWEGGLPYKVDSLALSTEGKSQLGGVMGPDISLSGKAGIDAKGNRIVFYSNAPDSGSSEVTLFEFDSDFCMVKNKNLEKECKLPGYALLNDFAVTENYAIFIQPPLETNMFPYMMSKDPYSSLKRNENENAIMHLVPRVDSNAPLKSFPIPVDDLSDCDAHFINAYENGDEVVLDVIRSDGRSSSGKNLSWPWAQSVEEYSQIASGKSLWRYRVQTKSGAIEKYLLSDQQCAFANVNPSVSGGKHRYIYSNVGGMGFDVAPPQGISKFDCDAGTVETWLPKAHEFCGEPMFAPRNKGVDSSSAEDDGYILSLLFNGEKEESEIIIFNAKSIASGPVARVPLGMSIPHGYFGCFASGQEAQWESEEIERRAKLADKMEQKGNRWNEVKSDFSGLGLRLDDFDEYFGDLL